MALEGTVKVPGLGTMRKQTAVYGGLAAVVGVLGVWWYRKRKASAAAATAAPAGTVTDPAGNTCSAVNPATGFCPGTAEDQAAQAGAIATNPFDTSSLGTGLAGPYYGPGGSVPGSAPGPGNFADNAEWAQYATNYLTGTLSADPGTVGAALGAYLAGAPVTSAQQNIIQEAIAVAGQPPQAGPGGDPPGINLSGTGGTGGGGGSGGGGGNPGGPPVGVGPGGSGGGPGAAAGAISNLQASHVTKSSFTVTWNPAPRATKGYAYALSQLNGVTVKRGSTSGHTLSFTGLHPGWTYNFAVQGLPGGPGNNIHIALPSK